MRRQLPGLILQLLAAGLLSTIAAAAEVDAELKAFPPAKKGMERFVIVLPHKERGEEDAFKVEIIAGKMLLTDGVNLMRLSSEVKPKTLHGWGYTYYEVHGSDVPISTKMAPIAGAEPVEKFVTGAPLLIRYSSRLPVVVYAPAGYDIRYRIWQAPELLENAEKR